MLTKNTFLIVISDDYDPSDDESGQQQELSKYFGLILSFSILKISVKHFTIYMYSRCLKVTVSIVAF